MLDKQGLLQSILKTLEDELVALKAATLATYDAATNEESKPENQYDTRALEASYLAGAQAKRLEEIENLIFVYRSAQLRNFSAQDTVDLTALIELKSPNQKTSSHVFMMSKGGGIRVNWQGLSVQTITPASPLGEALMGLALGDFAQIEEKNATKEYEVISLR